MMVMVPLPSVWILVQATMDFPERPDPEIRGWGDLSSLTADGCCCGRGLGGGLRILWLMSFSVTSPWAPLGFTSAKGYAMGVDTFALNLLKGLDLRPAAMQCGHSHKHIILSSAHALTPDCSSKSISDMDAANKSMLYSYTERNCTSIERLGNWGYRTLQHLSFTWLTWWLQALLCNHRTIGLSLFKVWLSPTADQKIKM